MLGKCPNCGGEVVKGKYGASTNRTLNATSILEIIKKSTKIIPDQTDTTLKYLQTLFPEHTSL